MVIFLAIPSLGCPFTFNFIVGDLSGDLGGLAFCESLFSGTASSYVELTLGLVFFNDIPSVLIFLDFSSVGYFMSDILVFSGRT